MEAIRGVASIVVITTTFQFTFLLTWWINRVVCAVNSVVVSYAVALMICWQLQN